MSNYEVHKLTLEENEHAIHGQTYLPVDAQSGKRCPLIICAHGLGGSHESNNKYADELAKRGYAVYSFDFSGTPNSKSKNATGEMTIDTELADIELIYNEFAKLPYVDLNNIFLLGRSLGGAVVALFAAKHNKIIKGLILLYPAFNIPQQIQTAWPNKDELPESYQVFDNDSSVISKAFALSAYDLDFYEDIARYAGPVLIIHGMADEVVASGFSVRAVNTYPHANLELIGEVGHGFDGGAFKYAIKKIVGFLDEEADLADESGLFGDLNLKGGGMFG